MSWSVCFRGLVVGLAIFPISLAHADQRFAVPKVRGVRLDWCAHFGTDCGKAAADLFCKENGLGAANRFAIDENIGRQGVATLVFGDGRLCQGPTCSGFRFVTCSKPRTAAAPPTLAPITPKLLPAPSSPKRAVKGSGTPSTPPKPPRAVIAKPISPKLLPAPPSPKREAKGAGTPKAPPNVAVLPVVPTPPARPPTEQLSAVPPPPSSPPPVQSTRKPPVGVGTPGAGQPANVAPIGPEKMTRFFCAESPLSCCPPGASVTDGCRTVTQEMLDIRLRSYVPPRFVTMGRNYPWGYDFALEDIVSDVKLDSPYKVWPGCRFDPNTANHAIDDSKSILEKAGELAEAWLGQWSGGVESAKSFVADGVADKICGAVDDTQSCRSNVASVVKAGINAGLAYLGIPPEIPDVQQLRQNGIEYLAAEAASYAVGELDVLNALPIDESTREQLYQAAYDKAANVIATELNKVLPPANFTSDNPVTWGHIEPAYAAHNAHLYVEVSIKPGMYQAYLKFIAAKPQQQWPPMRLTDISYIYDPIGPVYVPTFIPPNGIIMPFELKPHRVAETADDTAPTQIPGVKISKAWLQTKFGLSGSGLVYDQGNVDAFYHSGFQSDWDLFYKPYTTKTANFRVMMTAGSKLPGTFYWAKDVKVEVGNVWDADTGLGIADANNQLKNYVGRIDPAPRCNGKPNCVACD
jgi:hypothetical protein